MKRYLTILITFATLSAFGQGIGAWQLETAPTGQHYLIFSDKLTGVFDTIPADRLISDSLGYSRIDSIKCVSDTIRIYTNNGQFKMPFSCSGGGGGGGGITSLNGLTAGTQVFATGTSGTDVNISSATSTHTFNFPTASATNRGVLSTTDWTNFNSKPSGSGGTAQMAYWFSGSILTGENRFMYYNSSSRYIAGIGYTGGNGTFPDDLESSTNGYIASGTNAGIGLRAGSHIWSIATKSTGDLWFNKKGASWTTNPYMTLSSGGALTVSDLAGSGTRMVVASAAGLLSTQSIPSSSATNLTFSGTASPYSLNSSTGTGVRFLAGSNVTLTRSGNDLTINSTATSSGTTGLTYYGSIADVGSVTTVYLYQSVAGSTPTKITYLQSTGGNISYTGGTGNFNIPTTNGSGTYEILYSHNASSTSTTATKLWSGIYVNDVYVGGSTSFSINPFTTNQNYTFSGRVVTSLTSGQSVQVKITAQGATDTHSLSVSSAQLTLKKLN